jgi:hypothetical protein
MNEWKEIALEYKKELAGVLDDVGMALVYLSDNEPKAFGRATAILNKAIIVGEDTEKYMSIREIGLDGGQEFCIKKKTENRKSEKRYPDLLGW